MDNQTTQNNIIDFKQLSYNSDYYNFVFKKTERVVSAVFYILNHVPKTDSNRVHHDLLTTQALALHRAATDSLLCYEHEAATALAPLRHALLVLGSTVTVLTSARVIAPTLAALLEDELDLIIRYLRNHYQGETSPRTDRGTRDIAGRRGDALAAPARPRTPRRPRPQIPPNDMSSDAVLVYSALTDRTTRIKTVLEAKPNATIKDLTDIITDVSAKTIQRDLNDLIDRGQVVRYGERRWSTYSLKTAGE